MTRINLLWPKWARTVARLPFPAVVARGLRCWHTVQRAAELAVEALERKRTADAAPWRRPALWRSPSDARAWLFSKDRSDA